MFEWSQVSLNVLLLTVKRITFNEVGMPFSREYENYRFLDIKSHFLKDPVMQRGTVLSKYLWIADVWEHVGQMVPWSPYFSR